MNYETEIEVLNAETLAIQTIVMHVLARIAGISDELAFAVRQGFDDAASDAESSAIQLGKMTGTGHVVKTLHIIESLRTGTLGKPDKPKHAV